MPFRGASWRVQRAAALARDGRRCQRCGSVGPRLAVHHIVPFVLCPDETWANRLENLATLCPTCHAAAEVESRRAAAAMTQVAAARPGGAEQPGGRRGKLGRPADITPLVLLSLVGGPRHGYAMIEDIEQFSGTLLELGTLYGALMRLEKRGWIEPLPAEDRRHPYRLTAKGAAALREQ